MRWSIHLFVLLISMSIALGRASDLDIVSQLSEADGELYIKSNHELSKRFITPTSCMYYRKLTHSVLKSRIISNIYYTKVSYRTRCWGFFKCTKYRYEQRTSDRTEWYYEQESHTEIISYTCYNGGTCNSLSISECVCKIGWDGDDCNTETSLNIVLRSSSISTGSVRLHVRTSYYPDTPTILHVLNYRVFVKDITFKRDRSIYYSRNLLNFHINLDDLLPNREYEIYAIATNYPTTSISNKITFMTLTDKPSAAPNEFIAVPIDTITIMTHWCPPIKETQNGMITSYSIQYKRTDQSDMSPITDSTLETWYSIEPLEEYTEYSIKVAAVNSVGIGVYTEYQIIRTLEGVPTDFPVISFISRTSTSISLLLGPPSDLGHVNGILRKYVVEYYGETLDTDIRILQFVPPDNYLAPIETTIPDLEEGITYMIRGHMHTSIGGGPNNHHLEIPTLEDVPSGPPMNANFEYILPTSFLFNWNPPDLLLQNGIITGYSVEYYGQLVDMEERTFTTDIARGVIEDLEEGVPYQITICARTEVGFGPCLEIVKRTQEVIPGEAPINLKVVVDGSTVLSLIWEQISMEEENGIITMYHIIVTGQGFDSSIYELYTDSTNTYYSIESLQEANEYSIKVAAVNSAGIGPYSNEITAETRESSPSAAPNNVNGIPTIQEAILIWDDPNPLERNGEIIQYEIAYEGTIVDKTKHNIIVENAKFYWFRDLNEGERYQFRIRAFTEQGPGPYSRIFILNTLETKPGLPTNITLITISSTEIRVIWYEPLIAERNGVITGYDLVIAPRDNLNERTVIEIREQIRTYTFRNLNRETSYSIQVRARTQPGPGPYSEPVYAETSADPKSNVNK